MRPISPARVNSEVAMEENRRRMSGERLPHSAVATPPRHLDSPRRSYRAVSPVRASTRPVSPVRQVSPVRSPVRASTRPVSPARSPVRSPVRSTRPFVQAEGLPPGYRSLTRRGPDGKPIFGKTVFYTPRMPGNEDLDNFTPSTRSPSPVRAPVRAPVPRKFVRPPRPGLTPN